MKKQRNKRRNSIDGTPPFADYYKLPPRPPKKNIRVWFDNYLDFTERFPLGKMPSDLIDGHSMFMQETHDCNSLRSYYGNDFTKHKLNNYLLRLNRFLADYYGDHLSGVSTNPQNETIMYYDQNFINGLGAIKRGSNAARKTAASKPVKRNPGRSPQETEPEEKPKEVYFKKRDYQFATVDNVTESVKLIRRFVNLTGQKIETKRVAAFIRSLQKAIVQRLVTKKSPHAKDLAHIQEMAIHAYQNQRNGHTFIELSDKLRDKYYSIGRGEKVRGSIAALKRFVGLIGLPFTTELKNRIESIMNSISYMTKEGIIPKNDPYFDKVKEAYAAMKKAVSQHKPVSVAPSALNGIHGVIQYEQGENDFF